MQAEVAGGAYEAVEESGDPLWWIPLVTGSLWVIFALVVLQFDYTTVSALSILLGAVCLGAGLYEGVTAAGARVWWRAIHAALAVAFVAMGIAAFVHPENTFEALASIFAFYLLLRGIFDIIVALVARPAELWWAGLVSGVVLVGLAFWAAGECGHKAFLYAAWVGASALAQGVVQIVTAIRLRHGRTARPA